MENFRELEKEFKRKQFSKKALQHSNKQNREGREGSSSADDESDDDNQSYNSEDIYGEDSEEEDEGEEEKKEIVDTNEQRQKNLEMMTITKDFLKAEVIKVDNEIENNKNKKVKGATLKKHKEKITILSARSSLLKKHRDKMEELIGQIEYVESVQIVTLMGLLC